MQLDLENKDSVFYRIIEDRRAIKFRNKSRDINLMERINDKYFKLSVDPYSEAEDSFRSRKCPKCLKTNVGGYRIIYVVDNSQHIVLILDIGPRKNIYKKWD